MSREAVLDLFEGAARYLDGQSDALGARICPQHGVEHLGKTAYRIHLGLALHRERGADPEVLRKTALHLAGRCKKYPHPEARAFLFFERWPDKWNCSNHLIDSGAACDALGRVLIELPDLFDTDERAVVRKALERSAETYLWAASVDKPVPAQCLWGALGMARASVALDREDLADRAREAIQHAYKTLKTDGSWSYYPKGGEAGSEDASAFYHSRCIGFALEALELIGDSPREEPHHTNLSSALEFLLALHRRDGTKSRAFEAKLWYFDGPAEVASNSFDIYALLHGARAFDDPRYAVRARESLALLLAAADPSGAIQSGAPRAFQCPTFWTAHAGLLASVLPELESLDSTPAAEPAPSAQLFEQAGLARLDNASRTVLIRGARPAPSPGFGGASGGGSIVSDTKIGSPERVGFVAFAANAPGEFVVSRSRFRLSMSGARWKIALRWMRFSRWRWRCELRASGPLPCLSLIAATVAEVLAWCRTDAASHFACRAELSVDGAAVLIQSELAFVDGRALRGTRTERSVELTDRGLLIRESLTSERALSRVQYRLPSGASELQVNGKPSSSQHVEARVVEHLELEYLLS